MPKNRHIGANYLFWAQSALYHLSLHRDRGRTPPRHLLLKSLHKFYNKADVVNESRAGDSLESVTKKNYLLYIGFLILIIYEEYDDIREYENICILQVHIQDNWCECNFFSIRTQLWLSMWVQHFALILQIFLCFSSSSHSSYIPMQ